MKPLNIILTALIMGLLITPMCSAYNVSFASIDGAAERDILLYQGNTLLGQYNTSSTVSITNDTVIIFRPQTSDPLESPSTWLSTSVFPWLQTNATVLIIMGFLVMVVLMAVKK